MRLEDVIEQIDSDNENDVDIVGLRVCEDTRKGYLAGINSYQME